MKPEIVCLCGSTKFKKTYEQANLMFSLAGYIVLSVGCYSHSDSELNLTMQQKAALDILHLAKIDLADFVVVLDVDGYVGESTQREIYYALSKEKPIYYLLSDFVQQIMNERN